MKYRHICLCVTALKVRSSIWISFNHCRPPERDVWQTVDAIQWQALIRPHNKNYYYSAIHTLKLHRLLAVQMSWAVLAVQMCWAVLAVQMCWAFDWYSVFSYFKKNSKFCLSSGSAGTIFYFCNTFGSAAKK